MIHYESAIDDIATRLQGVEASLINSIADILAAARLPRAGARIPRACTRR